MRLLHGAALPLWLALAAPVLAIEGPSFECDQTENRAQELICADQGLAARDRHVAGVYADALAAVQELETGAEAAATDLRTRQSDWIGRRDGCWREPNPKGCLIAAYAHREGALVARWMLRPPVETISWTCDGNPANELVTMLFDSELQSIRFERGDSIEIGARIPTASGARFEARSGRMIWIHGDAATYRDPGGGDVDCVRSGT